MGFHLELIYLTPSHTAFCPRYLCDSPLQSTWGHLNLKFCCFLQQPKRLCCWEGEKQRGEGCTCMIDVEHRDNIKDSGAGTGMVVSVPCCTRLTLGREPNFRGTQCPQVWVCGSTACCTAAKQCLAAQSSSTLKYQVHMLSPPNLNYCTILWSHLSQAQLYGRQFLPLPDSCG